MRRLGNTILLSATDLMRFTGCNHATYLDLLHMDGEAPTPKTTDEETLLLQKQGDIHEAAHLAKLKSTRNGVVELARGDLAENAATTRNTLASGADVVFQGAFLAGRWGGWSDFLEKVEKPSALGTFSYEVADTKLKRRPHPKHLLQLVLYSHLLTEVQGVAPEHAHVELGDGTRASFRLAEYAAYAREARSRLEAFVAAPESTRPIPCADCSMCRWEDHCTSVWQAEDSLFNVANISRTQVKKLEAAGIHTMAALSTLPHPVRSLTAATQEKLVTQARLQHARKTGEPAYELRTTEPGKGFDLMPEPQPGDLFYDIEGDPHYEGGLEYLHGIWASDTGFHSIWAHDHATEAQAVEQLLAYFRARLTEYPQARIYHYAPYEITALRRLTAQYGIGEAFLDRLLRERRFIDLFAVVRGGIIASEANYSIKSMEAFYGQVRAGDVKSAGASVVAYERWRETGDPSILDEIEDYNRIDCISTEGLRNWLAQIRPSGPWPTLDESAEEKEAEEEAGTRQLRDMLAASALPPERQELLFNCALFHQREAKPGWWSVFDSLGKDDDELIDDLDALGGLCATGPATPIKRSMQRTYRFPEQETKLRKGASANIPTPEGFTSIGIDAFDRAQQTVTLKIGNSRAHLLVDQLSLHPASPLNTKGIVAAVRDVIDDQCGPKHYTALDDLLFRTAPRLSQGPDLATLINQGDVLQTTIAAVSRMQGTVLPIQGPPGTGKTYVTARTILALVAKGHRVGVTSASHEAIRNVLMECHSAQTAAAAKSTFTIAHKVGRTEDGYPIDFTGVQRASNNDDPVLSTAEIVGGTVFFFSLAGLEQTLDWLFVDEAGQVGLVNLLAMGRAARNIVLVGDSRQLPQVIQGTHPPPTHLSCLEWMQGNDATVRPDRGIFLPESRRMHPDVCRFISEQVYDSRLTSHADTIRQQISGTAYPETGAFWVPVDHEGNAQVSPEEADAIAQAIKALLSGQWSDKTGETRPMAANDIIVVAPYNAQVNTLRATLPPAVRVGTVDKFQGQEAPVCIVSMTASSTHDIPRGMDFLFSLNRINVAISRAKALALVFGSPRLREAKCHTVEQMKQVNVLCALDIADFKKTKDEQTDDQT